ncbi:hypothetical protein [Streptomyces sedi]|nr:hypothetical protein [Streptomyces sedi]
MAVTRRTVLGAAGAGGLVTAGAAWQAPGARALEANAEERGQGRAG